MKKNIRRIAPALLVLVALATLSFMAKDGITLRLRPEQGKTYTLTSKANMMTMMEVQGQTMNMSQNMETRQSFSVKKVSSAQSFIETQIEAIKMTISQMGMKLEYDSEHPEKTSPMLAGQTKEIENSLNKPITATYDALGKLVGNDLDPEMSQLSNVIVELPEQELTVGSKWNSTKSQTVSNVEINVNMEYTVTAISKKSVDVSFIGNVESTEVTGTYNGTASINPQTGIMMNSTTKSNISMTINEQGMSLPITMVGTTTVNVKDCVTPSFAQQLPKNEPQEQVQGLGNTALEQTIIRWDVQSRPQGADLFWRVVSKTPDVISTNNKYLMTTPYEATKALDIRGLTHQNSSNVRIILRCEKDGYMPQEKEFDVRMVLDQEEISAFFKLVKEE